MKHQLLTLMLGMALAQGALAAEGTPKIELDRLVYDFGTVLGERKVEGVFKVRNTGEGVLELERPVSSCGCTVPVLNQNRLEAGEETEIPFTIDLGRSKATLSRNITISSNDPENPKVLLTVKADYTPRFESSPAVVRANLRAGQETNLVVQLKRNDGQPVAGTLKTSNPWVTASLEPQGDGTSARLNILLRAQEKPGSLTEWVRLHVDDDEAPEVSVTVLGRLLGDIAATPENLLWNITDAVRANAGRNGALVTRRIALDLLAEGSSFTPSNLSSSVSGISLELATVEEGKRYQLVATLAEFPDKTARGTITMETGVASQPKLELPFTVLVPVQPRRN